MGDAGDDETRGWQELDAPSGPLLDEEQRQRALAELRANIAIGLADIEAGRVYPLDIDAIIAEGRRQLAARAQPA